MPDFTALVTPPKLVGPDMKPANGDIYVRSTNNVPKSGVIVIPFQAHGKIVNGEFKALNDTPFMLVVTPEGVALEIVVEIFQDSVNRKDKYSINRTVSVPNQSTVTWDALVDVVPVGGGTDYEVPAWVTTLLADAVAAGPIATDAANLALEALEQIDQKVAGVPTPEQINSTVTVAIAPKLDKTEAATTYAPKAVQAVVETGRLSASGVATTIGSTMIAPPPSKYAGVRTKTWNQAQCLYNGESAKLATIRSAIAAARTGTTAAVLAAVGDSKTAGVSGGNSMAEASYPGRLAEYLGAVDGMIYANVSDTRWSAITGWNPQAAFTKNYLGLAAGAVGSITLTTRHAHTGLKVYGYISGATGGTMTVTVDGGTPTTWTVPPSSPWRSTAITGLTNAVHTIKIDCTAPAGQTAAFLGVEPTYSTPKLRIVNAGRPGSSALDWKSATWTDIYPSLFGVGNGAITKPDYAITGIGTNENGSTFQDITDMITAINTLGVPQLLVAFGGLSDIAYYNNKRARLYDIADALDLPLIDFTQVIGHDVRAQALGFMYDTVHENANGYAVEAAAVARVIAL